MRKVNIFTDCTSDLNQELYEKYDITVLPLYVSFGNETYRDGVDISMEEMYKKIEEYNALPKSAALPPQMFIEEFNKIPSDEDIIFMGIGAGFSSTYSNAVIASKEFTNVYVVDSANLSSGIGLQLLKMAQFRDEGLGAEEIIKKMKEISPKVRTQFAINTLEYLHMGGRCSGTSRLFGTLLRIKPIIRVLNGSMEIAKKPLGKYTKALNVLLDYFAHDVKKIDPSAIMITHSLAKEEAKYLMDVIKNKYKFENVIETNASGVISTHCGPRTIGILYILK